MTLGLCYLFCFMSIDYFLTDRFINWEMTRHSIVYDAPFLALGGVLFLYKEPISNFVRNHSILTLFVAWGITGIYWFVTETQNGFLFVVTMTLVTASWLCYAIGTNGIVLNNRVTKYLSGISMEIYLCHMACFRVVGFLHLPNYINNIYAVYYISCALTILIAIVVSHVTKYYILPFVSTSLKNKLIIQ